MYIKRTLVVVTCISCLIGCGNAAVSKSEYDTVVEERDNYKKLYEDALAKVDSIEERVKNIEDKIAAEEAAEPYDYTADPNTMVVTLTPENIADYIGLVVLPGSNDTFFIQTHSLMYDQGYVLVGQTYDTITYDIGWVNDNGEVIVSNQSYIACSFPVVIAHGFTSREQAQEYADKGIMFYNPTLKYTDTTLYFQPKEYVGDNYLMEDGKRIVYGSEIRQDYYFASNPF